MCCTALIAISKKTETIYFVCFVGLIRLFYYTDSDRQKLLLQMKQIGESREEWRQEKRLVLTSAAIHLSEILKLFSRSLDADLNPVPLSKYKLLFLPPLPPPPPAPTFLKSPLSHLHEHSTSIKSINPVQAAHSLCPLWLSTVRCSQVYQHTRIHPSLRLTSSQRCSGVHYLMSACIMQEADEWH